MSDDHDVSIHTVCTYIGAWGLLVGFTLPVLDLILEEAPQTPVPVVVAVLVIAVALVASERVVDHLARLIKALRSDE